MRPRGGLFQHHGDAGSGRCGAGSCSIRDSTAEMVRAIRDVLLDPELRIRLERLGIASRVHVQLGARGRADLGCLRARGGGKARAMKAAAVQDAGVMKYTILKYYCLAAGFGFGSAEIVALRNQLAKRVESGRGDLTRTARFGW